MRVIKPKGLVHLGNNEFTWNGEDSLEIEPIKGSLVMRLLKKDSNTIWSLQVEFPYNIDLYPTINTVLVREATLVVDVGTNVSLDYNRYQLFRVYDISRTDTTVTCQCTPIFGDCESVIIQDIRPTDKTAKDALTDLFKGTQYLVDAVYNGTETTEPTYTSYWEWQNAMTALNGDNENSFIQRWGGEFFFDNYRIIWREHIDRFKGQPNSELIKITAGFNMSSIKDSVNDTDLVTEIWPVSYNGHHYKSGDQYTSIKSPNFDKFVRSYPQIIKYDNIKLREDANSDEIRNRYNYIIASVTRVNSSTSVTCSSMDYVETVTILNTNYSFDQNTINERGKNGTVVSWNVETVSGLKVGDIVLVNVVNAGQNRNNYIVVKITELPSNTVSIVGTSMGVVDIGYSDQVLPTVSTNYSYTQEQIEEYSKVDYEKTWDVATIHISEEQTIKAEDKVLIKVVNKTSSKYSYIMATVKEVKSDTQIVAISTGLFDEADSDDSATALLTNDAFTEDQIKQYSTSGYSQTWEVLNTYEVKAGTTVLLRVTNTSKNVTTIVCDTMDDLYQALRQEAEKEYSENHVDVPDISYTVEFIDLTGTVKYEGFEELVKLHLGDTVLIYNEELDIETTARITEIDYDVVNSLITKMTLGDYAKDYLEDQVAQNRTVNSIVNTSKTGVNGESIVGVQNGNSTQIQVSRNASNTGDIKVIKFEDTDKNSATFGAIAFGTEGLMATRNRLKDDSGWDWSNAVLLNEKATFYGKFGNRKGTKYLQFGDKDLTSYDSGLQGIGITGKTIGDQFTVINGLVVGQSQWKPITYSISISNNMLNLIDSNGNVSSVELPEIKTILTGDTGNGIADAVFNDDYTLTLKWTNGETFTTPSLRGAIGPQGIEGPQGIQGPKGEKGDSLTITYQDISYQEGESPVTPPIGSWLSNPPDVLPGNYLWTRVKLEYSDGSKLEYYSIARYGVDGGSGADGQNGVSVSKIEHWYLATGLDSGVDRDTPGWVTSPIPKIDSTKKYLWSYDKTTWSDGSVTFTTPGVVGAYGDTGEKGDPGENGAPGEPGEDGRTSYTHWAYANSSDGRIGFSVDDYHGKSYIGHYVDFEEADSTDPTRYKWSLIKGEDGKGIATITEHYNINNSPTEPPERWSNTPISPTPENPYAWYYETLTFSDDSTHDSTPRVIGVYGNSMAGMTPYYCLSTSREEFEAVEGAVWQTTMPSVTNDTYLWEKYIITMSDGSTKETDPVLHGAYTELKDKLNVEISTVKASIETAQDSILSTVKSQYVLSDDLQKYKSDMETTIQQTNSEIRQTVSQINSVESAVSGMQETVTNVNTYMSFDINGLELGKSNSPFKTKITNEKLAFTENDEEVAYLSNNTMFIKDGQFMNSLSIGNFGFVPRDNDSLDFKKVR